MLKLTNQPLSHIPLFPREMRRRERHFASPPLVSQVVWKVLERKLHAAWSTSPSSPPPSLRICNEVSSSYQATKKSTGAERPLPGETSSTCRVYVIVFDYKKFLRVAARVGVRSPPPPPEKNFLHIENSFVPKAFLHFSTRSIHFESNLKNFPRIKINERRLENVRIVFSTRKEVGKNWTRPLFHNPPHITSQLD